MQKKYPSTTEVIATVVVSAAMTIITTFSIWHASQSFETLKVTFALLGVPLMVIGFFAYLIQLGSGAMLGTTTAFAAVCFFDSCYEQYYYPGENSMPGFGIVYLCVPVAIISLFLLQFIYRRTRFSGPVFNFFFCFVISFAPVGGLTITSIVHQISAKSSVESIRIEPNHR
jgi:hypothetical protein